jgi:hypothetical protein
LFIVPGFEVTLRVKGQTSLKKHSRETTDTNVAPDTFA